MTISHRMSRTPTYTTWRGMVERCCNPNNSHWRHYGGKGILVCDAWLTFDGFFADMGVRPTGMSIDRINLDLGYSKQNCRWASTHQQARNRTDNVWMSGVVKGKHKKIGRMNLG